MPEHTEARRQAAVLQALSDLPGKLAEAEAGWRQQGHALEAGLAVYQGQAAATAARALAAAYPTVQALLGKETLAALAWPLWREHPPSQGDLAAWGDALPDWLAGRSELRDWPYLADGARLDWARHRAERAADVRFEPDSLALLGTRDPSDLVIDLRPGLSLIMSEWPVVTIWAAHQTAGDPGAAPRWAGLREALAARQAETAVVWRPHWRAEVAVLPPAMTRWMSALTADTPAPLSTLLNQEGPDFDLASWLALALRQGWIWRVRTVNDRAG